MSASSLPAPRRVTGRDVAAAVGVSQATVSLVFSGTKSTRISPETRRRVLEAAKSLGYVPQASGRQLRSGRTGMVLLAVPDMTAPFFAQVLAGAHDAADRIGLTVVTSSRWDSDRLMRAATAIQFDGLLICSPNDRQLGKLPPGVPAVFLDADPALAHQGHTVIELDVAAGITGLVDHLKGLGHHEIGRLRYPGNAYTFRARQRAFEAAAGGFVVVDQVVNEPAQLVDAARAARRLLAGRERLTAVVCDDDVLAAGAYHAAADLGLAIPDDLSVTGMDNVDVATFLRPGLTTADLGARELGAHGIEALARLLLAEALGKDAKVTARMVIRGSTCGVR